MSLSNITHVKTEEAGQRCPGAGRRWAAARAGRCAGQGPGPHGRQRQPGRGLAGGAGGCGGGGAVSAAGMRLHHMVPLWAVSVHLACIPRSHITSFQWWALEREHEFILTWRVSPPDLAKQILDSRCMLG